MKKKLLIIGLIMVICFGIFSGCNNYNAVLYDTAIEWMRDDYIADNVTRNFLNPDSQSAPETITHIISTREDFDMAFNEFPTEVDFDNEMLIIYFFTAFFSAPSIKKGNYRHEIEKLKVSDGVINITFVSITLVGGPISTPPTQNCFVVKMDKVEADKVNIVF